MLLRYSSRQMTSWEIRGSQLCRWQWTRVFLDVVRCLLKAKIDVNATKENGMSPLFISASKGHLAIVQALLDQRASANLAERHGATPLYISSQMGHFDVAQCLLDARASVDTARSHLVTPLYIAMAKQW